jgi:hypothetical protein
MTKTKKYQAGRKLQNEVACPENLRQSDGVCFQTGLQCTSRDGTFCPQIAQYKSRRARCPPRTNDHGYGNPEGAFA